LLVVALEEEIMVVVAVLVELYFTEVLHQIKQIMVLQYHLMDLMLLLLVRVVLVDSIRKPDGQEQEEEYLRDLTL
jgi:hypothetical protein|tara:strand:+ start:135 stop:359 length:225 start_codon:yes stop_codon:yes gene_type:complete